MLFYNHKHEFIGIDEDGLKLLNYATLDDLLGVCGDVADLFAKEPGYIHNFKSFGWIDFLLHADSDARSAIVHAHGRTFSCTLTVHNFYLCAEPEHNGYMIDMTHIQSISGDDTKPFIAEKPSHYFLKETAEQPNINQSTQPIVNTVEETLPNYTHITPTILSEPNTLDVPQYEDENQNLTTEDMYANLTLPLTDEELNENTEVLSSPKPAKVERPMLGDVHYTSAEKEFLDTLKVDRNYRFDPNIAAHELGLPVDLIQEFIGDFIQQAYEFKAELFEAALKGDTNNVKILSHKLKGVAANLRIEDAFETLSVVNTSSDPVEIEANLKYFYTIITKLEGKEPVEEKETAPFLKSEAVETPAAEVPVSESAKTLSDDDIYTFSLKDDTPVVVETEKEKETEKEEEVFLKPTGIELSEVDLTPSVEKSDEKNSTPEFPTPPLHYDKVLISGELGIEHDFFDELIEEYKHDALRAGKEIAAAIGAFDTHAWKNSASQLKGISDNLRLSEISDELAILSHTNDAQEANKASKRLNSFIEQL